MDRQDRKWLTPVHRWTLAGFSVGAFTAAVVALVLSQLVPVILESVAPSVSDRSPWLVQITVALSMSFGVLVGFGAGYRAVARHGSTLVREGWDEKIVALAVTILPWIAYLVWLWWQIQ